MSNTESSNFGLATIEKYGHKLGILSSGNFVFYESVKNSNGRIEYAVSNNKNTLELMPQRVFDELSDVLISYRNSKK